MIILRILFCNIAWMEYYQGITDNDKPKGGGSFVQETEDAYEKYNFMPANLHFEDNFFPDGEYCLGFVETKATTANKRNQLHIEKIDGCELCSKNEYVEDILVVYCATHPIHGFTTVVGWYNHATVYRNYMEVGFEQAGSEIYWQAYNAIAKASDCVLLPHSERSQSLKWKVPRKNGGISYGFGRANVWFASGQKENEYLRKYIAELAERINHYCGTNWLNEV